jgi:hypothetical protein
MFRASTENAGLGPLARHDPVDTYLLGKTGAKLVPYGLFVPCDYR